MILNTISFIFKQRAIEIGDLINSHPSHLPYSISLNGSWGSAIALSNSAGESVKGIGDILFDKPLSKRKKDLHRIMYETYHGTSKKKLF